MAYGETRLTFRLLEKSQCHCHIIDERRLIFMMKLLYHDNTVLRMLASLPVVYYEYISSQYAIKDSLCSRKYIREFVWNAFCNRVF